MAAQPFVAPALLTQAAAFLGTFVIAACGRSARGNAGGPTLGVSAENGRASSAGDLRIPRVTGRDGGRLVGPQTLSANIVVDQFGYLTSSEKIAVIRKPQGGPGATFSPGSNYALIDAHTGKTVFEGTPVAWNGGATDPSSGDMAWWFGFSNVATAGEYFVLDRSQNARSDVFQIGDGVYRAVLVQATRMLYYQRDGIAKDAKHAGQGWADAMAHPQDERCRPYSSPRDGTARDLRGGWFDAGDQNKYTNWGASDVIELLRAYRENPRAFTDDTNIPESGNGVPDLLDEVRWEVDWVARMQADDGSVLSIVVHPGRGDGDPLNQSPPSIDDGPCLYGSSTTSATLSAAAALAYAAIVFRTSTAATVYSGYANSLASRAQRAWTWAQNNPRVTFCNQSPSANVTCQAQSTLGGGNQETDDEGRLEKKLQAAVFLFELTGDVKYRAVFDSTYGSTTFQYADMLRLEPNDTMLEYAKAQNSTPSVVSEIESKFRTAMDGPNNFGALKANNDPYFAYIYGYWWGSNAQKAAQGDLFYDVIAFGLQPTRNMDAARAAERYVHYLHGVNPLGLVYLSNMGAYGAANSVTRFFHSWFAHGSLKWDTVGLSTYGPPPGYLTGGPNPSYTWDHCCPSSCAGGRVACGASVLSPPAGQPAQKSYLEFNDGWPIDSWEVTEPSDGYQALYIRLLSKFVP